ncbi:dihydrofolate reductase family protein [Microbacterium sp. No. 7]|uniref:dihydrofolate reductase family protein n=1 Tax=Microbacterium sp. No. 7 TaxID=1714373 RepID=UPI0006D228FF|nr:dihydrofolate reductase family protein [Microbacterium sp. No. 7]ALJ20545.1 deaminase [Microbacterium sp. No. 7]
MSGQTPEATEQPQQGHGRVLWGFMTSLDGFVAGPQHSVDWMGTGGYRTEPGVIEGYIEGTGAIIAGRDGWDSPVGHSPWGGAWQGPIFVLTHHPEDAEPAENVTFLHRDPSDVVQLALAAAGGKDVMVFSPSIGAQLLELGLIDEIDLHIAPVLLGDGIRLYSMPGGRPVRLSPLSGDPASTVRVRYRPVS